MCVCVCVHFYFFIRVHRSIDRCEGRKSVRLQVIARHSRSPLFVFYLDIFNLSSVKLSRRNSLFCLLRFLRVCRSLFNFFFAPSSFFLSSLSPNLLVFIFIFIFTRVHTYIHLHTYNFRDRVNNSMYIQMNVQVYLYLLYVCTPVCRYVYLYIYICTSVFFFQ